MILGKKPFSQLTVEEMQAAIEELQAEREALRNEAIKEKAIKEAKGINGETKVSSGGKKKTRAPSEADLLAREMLRLMKEDL